MAKIQFKLKSVDDYSAKANAFRGRIIGVSITIEKFIEMYIADYFSKDKQKNEDLRYFIIYTCLTLTQKTDILKKIMEKRDRGFIKENPSFFEDVKDFISIRNIVSHAMLDVRDFSANLDIDKVDFIRHKNELKQFTYKKENIERKIKNVIKHSTALFHWMRRGQVTAPTL